jgi:hypothetical protein
MHLAIEWKTFQPFALGVATGFVLFGLMIGFVLITDVTKANQNLS